MSICPQKWRLVTLVRMEVSRFFDLMKFAEGYVWGPITVTCGKKAVAFLSNWLLTQSWCRGGHDGVRPEQSEAQ